MQNKVSNFNKLRHVHTKPMPVYARLLDIQSELGELSKEFLSPTKYGTQNFEVTNDFKMEFGDTLYSLLSLADELNFSAEECLDLVLKKYQERLNKNNNMASKN